MTTLDAGRDAWSDAKRLQKARRLIRETSHNELSAYLRNSRKEAVSAIVPEPGLSGHVRLSFLGAVPAAAYGIYVSHGEGHPFVHVLTMHDTVEDLVLTPGANVRIRVKASNAAGQSAASPIAEVTVPLALAEAA